jgi:hypothetical protein
MAVLTETAPDHGTHSRIVFHQEQPHIGILAALPRCPAGDSGILQVRVV